MVPGMAPEQPRIWSAGAPEHRLAPRRESQALCPLGVMRMSNSRAGSRKSTDSKRSKKGRVKRTIFPREATAQEIADQINAMPKQTKG